MDNGNQLILSARLEEGMLDVGEEDVNFVSLGRSVPHTVLVQLQVSNSLSTFKVWLDHDIL